MNHSLPPQPQPSPSLTILDRVAARVLVVDPDDAVLLFRGSDPARPDGGTWWFTPGGGVEDGEALSEAARRELLEETGMALEDVGAVRFDRIVVFDFEGERYRQHEYFFAVHIDRFEPDVRGWTDIERRSMSEHRWWTAAEITASDETFHPEDLVARLDAITE